MYRPQSRLTVNICTFSFRISDSTTHCVNTKQCTLPHLRKTLGKRFSCFLYVDLRVPDHRNHVELISSWIMIQPTYHQRLFPARDLQEDT